MGRMSTLLDRASGPGRPVGGEPPPSPFSTPVLAAVRAVAGALVALLVPVVFSWVLGAGGQSSWVQAVKLGFGLWLLAHHVELGISGGQIGLAPIGLVLLPLLSCGFTGRRLARTMDPNADRIAAGATRARPAMLTWRCLLLFAGSYCLIGSLLALLTVMPGLHPDPVRAVLGTALVSLVGGGLGACAYRFRGLVPGLDALVRRLPERVRPWMRPAVGATAVQLAAGALLLVASIGFGASRVTALHRAVDPGLVGGAVLTLGEVLLVPNLVVWACAVAAGPGFAIGAGTSLTVWGVTLGPLPAIPVLAALPSPGVPPRYAVALLLLPVLSGAVAGVLVGRVPARTVRPRLSARLERALGAGLVTGLIWTALGWLAGGSAGPGRLAAVGPQPLLLGGAVAVETAVGALLAVLAVTAWRRLAGLARS